MTEVRVSPSGAFDDIEGGAAPPLSSVFYVDLSTTVIEADQDGSMGAPWSSLAVAVAARAGVGGTFYIVPNDYTAQVVPELDGSGEWCFIGLDMSQLPQTAAGVAPAGPPTLMPAITIGASSPNFVARSLNFPNGVTQAGGANIFATDCKFLLLAGGGSIASEVSAQRCYFDGSGVGSFAFYNFERCGFFGSQNLLVVDQGTVKMTRCYGQTSVNFAGDPGFVRCDLWTRQELEFQVLTNCTAVTECTIQSITGATEQEQLDSIIAAGVLLGFWTDDRVP